MRVIIAIGDEGKKNYPISMTDAEVIANYNGSSKNEVKPDKEELKELWKSFYAGGGKNAVYDVRLGDKSGKLAEGGDNISKEDALALVEKLNA